MIGMLGFLAGVLLGRRLARWAGYGFFAAVAAFPLSAQTPAHVIVVQDVRDYLAREWDAHATNPYAHERAYCVGVKPFHHVVTGNHLFLITDIAPASVSESSARRIVFKGCGLGRTSIHVHTPATCTSDTTCVLGGYGAWICNPSDEDRAGLKRSGLAFAGLQCSREALVFYFHPDLKPRAVSR